MFVLSNRLVLSKGLNITSGLICLIFSLGFSLVVLVSTPNVNAAQLPTKERAIINHLIVLGHTKYQDAVKSAQRLNQAIHQFLANPTASTHNQAKLAYRSSRVAYQQTEAFRFAHPEVDNLEGRVNAWPLDEGFVDYVTPQYKGGHTFATANLIAADSLKIGAKTLNLKHFDVRTLRELHEFAGHESNVATGYHAIEFLLWGQDLSGPRYGAGMRSHTDYLLQSCTGGHCERRRNYLLAVTKLLVADLTEMQALFTPSGAITQRLAKTDDKAVLKSMIEGLASLSYGELAGERMQLGLLLGDPEEEHDCFSDLTHLSHYYNVVGMHNVYFGSFTDLADNTIKGPSLAEYVQATYPQEAQLLDQAFAASLSHAKLIYNMAEHTGAASPMSYDMMLAPDNLAGRQLIQNLIAALKDTTTHLVAVGAKLGFTLNPEGSDSLDNPDQVIKDVAE